MGQASLVRMNAALIMSLRFRKTVRAALCKEAANPEVVGQEV